MHIFIEFIKGEMSPPIALRTDASAKRFFKAYLEEYLGEEHGIDIDSDDADKQANQMLTAREINWVKKITCE
jgi:hypothetical protein